MEPTVYSLTILRPTGRHRAPRARHARTAEPVRVTSASAPEPLDGETLALVRPYFTAHERQHGRRALLVATRFVMAVPR
jgi:hypothetical protein